MIPHTNWSFEWENPVKNHMETMGFDGDFFGDFSKKNWVF